MSCTEDFLEVDLPEKDESSTSIFIIASPLQVPPLPQVRCYLGISYPWKFLLFLFGEKAVRVFGLRNPKDNPWAEGGAEFVVESTGVLTDMDKVASHLKGKYLQAWSVMVAPKSEIGSLFENNFKAAAASVFPDDGQVDSPLGEAQKLLGGSFMKRFPLKDPRIQVVRNLFLTSEPVSSISWRSYYILTMDLYVFPTPYMITWDYYFETREHILMNQSWETRQIWNM